MSIGLDRALQRRDSSTESQLTMDAVRQLQASLAELQMTIDELTVKLSEQQRHLRTAHATLDSLVAQLGALQVDGDAPPPAIT
jgi:uncharacterized coiled-coil protein SlyX